jgi:type IV pilus assembly protein PilM
LIDGKIKLMKFPSFFPKSSVGIDIGTSDIKVVQLSSFAGRIKLENYGQISSKALYQKPFRTFEKSTLLLSTQDIVKAIRAIFEEAKIKTKTAHFSIPDFTTFFTTFELPPMTKDEIKFAVEAEARRHIPLPISEVVWDWQIIGRRPFAGRERFRILLVSVPREVVNQFSLISKSLGIETFSLEAETFSLMRAFFEKGRIMAIIDIGARSTSCTIIQGKILKISRSLELSEDDFSYAISKSLGVDQDFADELKRKYGIEPTSIPEGKEIREILIPLINSLLQEIEQTFLKFKNIEGKEIEKIILTGGGAKLPGLLQYFQNYFKKEVEIANPFKKIYFPPILEETLKEMGPSFSVAVGLALKGFE